MAILVTAVLFAPTPARAETTNCTAITSLPAVIDTQGIYCFTGHLSTADTSGNAIEITTNNVVIDFNGYKLGGLGGGAATYANGIYAYQRKNITIRNGSIRGFYRGIWLHDSSSYTASSGHLVEDINADGNTFVGIMVAGTGNTVRNNRIVSTGGSTNFMYAYGIVVYGPGVRVLSNDITDVAAQSTAHSKGIYLISCSNTVVEGNRINDLTSPSGYTYGIFMLNSTYVTSSENRVSGVADYGIVYNSSTGLYMGNIVSGATTPFSGGTAAGTTNFSL